MSDKLSDDERARERFRAAMSPLPCEWSERDGKFMDAGVQLAWFAWNKALAALPAPAISESDGLLQLVVAWRMDICVTAGDVRATAHRQPDHRVYVVEKPGDSVESLSRAIKNAAAAIDTARKGEKP
ncbi:hypothetical protein [Burkholderia glumae]|uniref:hypothetical protein n=1 Tax=Burkholderia glumae TaxID=337 RepID=UPI0021511567|nr:hypothetical protein [Burkholderia glumae]